MLLHAGVADRTMWSEHLGPLSAAGYRVVAMDLPGFGEAPAATAESAPWADVLETMDGLGLDRAGHLAPLETPDAFRKLLLEFLRERG